MPKIILTRSPEKRKKKEKRILTRRMGLDKVLALIDLRFNDIYRYNKTTVGIRIVYALQTINSNGLN